MEARFAAGGVLRLDVLDGSPDLIASLTRELRPWRPAGPGDAPSAVRLRVVDGPPPECAEILGDAGDGRITGVSPTGLVVHEGRSWWSIPDGPDLTRLEAGRSMTGWAMVSTVLRPAALLAAGGAGGAAMHATLVDRGGSRIALAGWAESGKTETALAMAEAGCAIVSDKWAIVGPDGSAVGVPGPVHVRDWVLRWLPGLRSAIGVRSRARARVARAGTRVATTLSALPGPGSAVVARRMGELAELGTRTRFSVDGVNAALGLGTPPDAARLDVVVLLRRGPDERIAVTEGERDSVAAAIARSTAFERRGLAELANRAAFAARGPGLAGLDDRDRQAAALPELLAAARILEVQTPFPVDPRRVRDALIPRLVS